MKKFFTISEFAKLRNFNINSLRYYEKIGLLKPVYVAPETNFAITRQNSFLIWIQFYCVFNWEFP